MSQLGYMLNYMVKTTHKEGGFNTRDSRSKLLNLAAKQLLAKGFKLRDPKGLKTKHVNYLVEKWQSEGIAPKTMKNRLSALRWWADKIGKRNVVAKDNDSYGIPRVRSNPIGKSKQLDQEKLTQIPCDRLKLSLRLQQQFGLRREESIKFDLSYAMRSDHIRIKGSWAKGGKYREIPITRQSQLDLLKDIKALPQSTLIPADKNYKQQLERYERETDKVGLNKNHGLRHHYTRERYLELTGWQCPADGGPSRRALSAEHYAIDTAIRLQISKELGHERLNITYSYLGS
ncbi:phage integrase N-terminal domain-containing protein [Alkalimonas amylolytica]|uniref:Site-specific recombinase XerC n=1 Tax=Alkalimonas amylolytica TaxID=152573 RepID=A0A1H3XSZ5_ALKAM|nr:phage integrase N-terminal domain-containing protein [Alkalimonas amylolytica]SEA01724.1 Site-specific recombinase XerC [Alkalimonas amylolytica]